jgi:hypothetical protein
MGRKAIIGGNGYSILGDSRGGSLLIGNAVDEILAVAGADPDDVSSADKSAIAQRVMAAGALIVRDDPPTNARRFPLGFESSAPIAAGASVTITARPQTLFKGQRLVLPSDIAGDFVIDDLKVGKDSQFVAEGSIPGRVLQENATNVDFDLDTAQISQDISISVTNIGGAPRTFRAALWGKVAE